MLKKCHKCGRTSPPALVVCPRCKTPFNTPSADKSSGHQPTGSAGTERTSSSPSNTRKVVTASVLAVLILILAATLFINRQQLTAGFSQSSDNIPVLSQKIVRPSNFNELLGTWSGREINSSKDWTFIFSDGYNVHAEGIDGWYRGKVGIHWDLGGDERGLKVPPGAGVFDVDVTESSLGNYVGKTSLGAFSIHGGSNLKLCSGDPGKTKRPESFEPLPGIRCFELTKTAEAPGPPPSRNIAGSAATSTDAPSVEDEETRAARQVYKSCDEAIRSGNMALAKTYISKATLQDMEQSGQIDTAMGMIAGMNIDTFQASRQGDIITFSQSQKQGDATMSISFKMVKEDGLWKLGN